MEKKGKLRLLIFFIIFLLFSGLLTYSLLKVRYDVSGSKQKEPYIVEKSITHSIARNQDGNLVNVGGASVSSDTELSVDTGSNKAVPQKPAVKNKPKPCPT